MATDAKDLQVQESDKQEVTTLEGTERTRDRKIFVPRTDIYETDDDILLVADMPGVDENSVDVTLEKNVLTIKGYVEWTEPENYELAYAEYDEGDFERSFTLSNQINFEKIEATVKDGVLRLRLPKAGVVKTKRIAVKSA
jgi:HSP20 family molecular chaperone IbpA